MDAETVGGVAPLCEEDRSWFESQVVELLPDLYGTALRFTRNRADAEDLVADALHRGWARLATLGDRNCFRGWIFRILTNTFISDRRSRAARPEQEPLPDDPDDFSIFEQLHQPFLLWWGNPEQAFLNRLLRDDLERAINGLPDSFRVAVVLADVQGLSYQEIAESLDVPVGTVRSRLARGRSLLQKALWEHGRETGLVSSDPAPSPHTGAQSDE